MLVTKPSVAVETSVPAAAGVEAGLRAVTCKTVLTAIASSSPARAPRKAPIDGPHRPIQVSPLLPPTRKLDRATGPPSKAGGLRGDDQGQQRRIRVLIRAKGGIGVHVPLNATTGNQAAVAMSITLLRTRHGEI
jgi:hypothetical protein